MSCNPRRNMFEEECFRLVHGARAFERCHRAPAQMLTFGAKINRSVTPAFFALPEPWWQGQRSSHELQRPCLGPPQPCLAHTSQAALAGDWVRRPHCAPTVPRRPSPPRAPPHTLPVHHLALLYPSLPPPTLPPLLSTRSTPSRPRCGGDLPFVIWHSLLLQGGTRVGVELASRAAGGAPHFFCRFKDQRECSRRLQRRQKQQLQWQCQPERQLLKHMRRPWRLEFFCCKAPRGSGLVASVTIDGGVALMRPPVPCAYHGIRIRARGVTLPGSPRRVHCISTGGGRLNEN